MCDTHIYLGRAACMHAMCDTHVMCCAHTLHVCTRPRVICTHTILWCVHVVCMCGTCMQSVWDPCVPVICVCVHLLRGKEQSSVLPPDTLCHSRTVTHQLCECQSREHMGNPGQLFWLPTWGRVLLLQLTAVNVSALPSGTLLIKPCHTWLLQNDHLLC